MKILLSIIVTFVCMIFFLIPSDSYASTCAVKETIYSPPQFFLLSDNVFAGNVTSITDYGNHQWQVHFDIEKIWKGVASRQTSTVMTGTLQACGYSIIVGEKYLIYTNGSPPFINPIYSKSYSDAQDDITLFDDPKFQSEEKIKEELNKKLEAAQGRVGSMMMDKSSHIPVITVGVDQVNSTLDITIDDQRATRSIEQYRQDLKEILGDIPIKAEFGHATTLLPILRSADDKGKTTSYPVIHDSNFGNVLKSPLKQFKGGIIPISDVKCMYGFDRLVKTSDGSPACVKPLSGKILIERGWATRTIKVQNTDFEINYAITGGKLTGATEDLYPQELILSLQTSSDGYLTVNIPKGLINLRNIDYWTDGTIHVSANHKEINFKQFKSLGYVVITIPLKSGMTQVEISSGIPGAVEEGK